MGGYAMLLDWKTQYCYEVISLNLSINSRQSQVQSQQKFLVEMSKLILKCI